MSRRNFMEDRVREIVRLINEGLKILTNKNERAL